MGIVRINHVFSIILAFFAMILIVQPVCADNAICQHSVQRFRWELHRGHHFFQWQGHPVAIYPDENFRPRPAGRRSSCL